MQPDCTAVSTPWHTGRGLAGHPRCVSVGNQHGKMRLFTPIRSKTTALPRCARHLSAQRRRPCPPRRSDESAGKRSHRNRSSSPERVRLLQPLLPRPQERRRPFTLTQILSQICLGEWFMLLDLKDAYFHIQIAPHHRRFLRFAFEGVAYQYKVLLLGLSLAARTFTRCMNLALSPLRQMGIRILIYLDDWLILAQLQAVLTFTAYKC